MRRLVPVLALVSLAACVPQAWRGFAPKMRLGTNVAAPTFKQVSLPNGLTLLVHEDGRAPVTTVLVALRAGGSTDPAGKAGLATLTEQLAGHGAGTRDEQALQTSFDRLGSPLGNLVSADQSVYGVTVMPFDTGPALALLSDVVQRPRFESFGVRPGEVPGHRRRRDPGHRPPGPGHPGPAPDHLRRHEPLRPQARRHPQEPRRPSPSTT